MKPRVILALSGSLRTGSSNTVLLEAIAELAPSDVSFEFYRGIGELPHYNPDREDDAIPVVVDWRARVSAADGILICSPEYACGVPGALKNALDWLVGGIEIVGKPVALINASPYSTHAHGSLLIILATMSARVISEASVTVPLRGKKLTSVEIVQDPALAAKLRSALNILLREIAERK